MSSTGKKIFKTKPFVHDFNTLLKRNIKIPISELEESKVSKKVHETNKNEKHIKEKDKINTNKPDTFSIYENTDENDLLNSFKETHDNSDLTGDINLDPVQSQNQEIEKKQINDEINEKYWQLRNINLNQKHKDELIEFAYSKPSEYFTSKFNNLCNYLFQESIEYKICTKKVLEGLTNIEEIKSKESKEIDNKIVNIIRTKKFTKFLLKFEGTIGEQEIQEEDKNQIIVDEIKNHMTQNISTYFSNEIMRKLKENIIGKYKSLLLNSKSKNSKKIYSFLHDKLSKYNLAYLIVFEKEFEKSVKKLCGIEIYHESESFYLKFQSILKIVEKDYNDEVNFCQILKKIDELINNIKQFNKTYCEEQLFAVKKRIPKTEQQEKIEIKIKIRKNQNLKNKLNNDFITTNNSLPLREEVFSDICRNFQNNSPLRDLNFDLFSNHSCNEIDIENESYENEFIPC